MHVLLGFVTGMRDSYARAGDFATKRRESAVFVAVMMQRRISGTIGAHVYCWDEARRFSFVARRTAERVAAALASA
jgi:hypothetical protein